MLVSFLFVAIFTLGYIIVLAVIGANPCKDVSNDDNQNKICNYSAATVRAIVVITALIVLACCGKSRCGQWSNVYSACPTLRLLSTLIGCCIYCARMHVQNLQIRDNGGVAPART